MTHFKGPSSFWARSIPAYLLNFVSPFMCVGSCTYRCSVYAGMVLAYIMLGLSLSHAVKIYIPGLTTNYSRSISTISGSIRRLLYFFTFGLYTGIISFRQRKQIWL